MIQKSIREGFGLVVSEALWKGTPVVAGRAGGIPLQMADGVGGLLVDSVEECGEAIAALLDDRARAEELAARGRERVRRQFLLPRLLLNELLLVDRLVAGERPTAADRTPRRDPVCGMVIDAGSEAATERYENREYFFCSRACQLRFRKRPQHYLSATAEP